MRSSGCRKIHPKTLATPPIKKFSINLSRGMYSLTDWNNINTIRTLAIDMVQAANSGHPGAALGLAPLAYVLFKDFLRFSPSNPKWANRDRFVLSNGHACALQYSLLHLFGYPLSLDDLKAFRQLHSKTPGHPENTLTEGIEVTTGPLGQGFANAVGIAMAQKHMAALYNTNDRKELELFNGRCFVIVGDGCLQEGVCAEAASLAGYAHLCAATYFYSHLGLDNLVVLYDDNEISIDGSTSLSFSEDTLLRFKSYGFNTATVADGDNDLMGIKGAISNALSNNNGKPSFIKIRTTIGKCSSLQGTAKVHGSPLGADEVRKVKQVFGMDPDQHFFVSNEVRSAFELISKQKQNDENSWISTFAQYQKEFPGKATELLRRFDEKKFDCGLDLRQLLPRYIPSGSVAKMATRKHSEVVLNAIGQSLIGLIGGSADLTPSTLTKWKGSEDFQKNSFFGRYLRFGVREHAMAAILNGICASFGRNCFIAFGSTFLNFVEYAMGAVRLSALSHFPVIYIMTHDSIGLGEDGPTHQAVEALTLLRATPNMTLMRPADGNEVSACYYYAINNRNGPTTLCLTRQNVPELENSCFDSCLRGAYVLSENPSARVTLVGTGSEVSLLVEAAKILSLNAHKIPCRTVSFPCWELFEQQSEEYRKSVFPPGIPTVSVEAGSTIAWSRYAQLSLGVDTFGHSAPYEKVYESFGLTPEAISQRIIEFLKKK